MEALGVIDKDGNLLISRNRRLKSQYCPFAYPSHHPTDDVTVHAQCGDWCPMFGETVKAGHLVYLHCGGDHMMIVTITEDCRGKK